MLTHYEHDLQTKPGVMRDRTYESIQEAISLTLRNQRALIDDGVDFSILVSVMPRFPNLSYFFVGLQEEGGAGMSGIPHNFIPPLSRTSDTSCSTMMQRKPGVWSFHPHSHLQSSSDRTMYRFDFAVTLPKPRLRFHIV